MVQTYCMGEGRLGPPSALDLSHCTESRYENSPMMIGTDSGATCDVTWDIVRTLPRGAVLIIETFDMRHWWNMQMNERKANIIPTRLIKIPVAIRQVFRTTHFRDALSCAVTRVEEGPSDF